MQLTLVLALALAGIFILGETHALPSDVKIVKEAKESKSLRDTASASKDVKDAIKAAKDTKKSKKECMKECESEYDPVCVHDPADPSYKPRTFGTQCAMEVHNCEMGTRLVVKNKGECPGSGGVRLS